MNDKSEYPRAGDRGPGPSAGDLSDPVARVVREEIRKEFGFVRDELRDELREQSRRRTVRLYGGAAAATLYAGGALTAFLVLLLALTMPAWAAALIVGVMLTVLAAVLKNSASPHPPAAPTGPSGHAAPTAPTVPTAPGNPPTAPGNPPTAPDTPPTPPEPPADPQAPHHRG